MELILGIGSNLGDRLTHLRNALKYIKKIPALTVEKVSPVYQSDALLPDNSPPEWNKKFYNAAIRCSTKLTPHELLAHTQAIEKRVGRTLEKKWGPRIVDIDI